MDSIVRMGGDGSWYSARRLNHLKSIWRCQKNRCNVNKETKQILISASLILVGYFSWQWDTYARYFEFRALCKKDSGLQMFEKILKDQVWEADSLPVAEGYARKLKSVRFIRAPDRDKKLVDIKYVGGLWGGDRSYSMRPADVSIAPKYKIYIGTAPETDDHRIWKSVAIVTDFQSNKLVYQFNNYLFKWFHPDKFIKSLFTPGGHLQCPEQDVGAEIGVINQFGFSE